jgi:hypothetical protein
VNICARVDAQGHRDFSHLHRVTWPRPVTRQPFRIIFGISIPWSRFTACQRQVATTRLRERIHLSQAG